MRAQRFLLHARYVESNPPRELFLLLLPSTVASGHPWSCVRPAPGRRCSAGRSAFSVPQLKVRGTVARTAPARELFVGNVFDEKLGIRRRQDGGYTVAHGTILDHGITPSTFRYAFKFLPALLQEIGSLRIRFGKDFIDEITTPKRWAMDEVSPFEKTRVLNPPPNPRVVRGIRKNLDELFPALAKVDIVETWAGMVETSPDVVPMIGEVGDVAGFYIASGFSGHGFGIGPGAGKALAAMLTGADNPIDLEPFRLARFFDGSPIKPMSAI